jgi:cytochrome b6-f complex iron-sulfur subunit
MERRSFLFVSASVSILLLLADSVLATFRFLVPRITYEPPSKFPVGRVKDFPSDSATFLPPARLFVFNSREGLYAISSICTHLGCNVRWVEERSEFHCPCHGSKYTGLGKVKEGPAPKPLKWYKLSLSRRGEIVVDTKSEVSSDYRLVI